MTDARIADFETRHARLRGLTDEQLKERFWELCHQSVAPIVELARTHTSPSIERSVLLRMGIDSVTTHGIVERVLEAGLLGHGAGHALLKVAQKTGKDLRGAAQAVLDDPSLLQGLFQRER